MKALVTGGGGFLGRYIAEALLARGDAVRVIGRRKYPELTEQGIECHLVDLTDGTAVREAAHGMDAVFHVAAKAGFWGDPAEFEATNVLGPRNVLAACRAHRIPKLIHTSTPSVVAHPGPLEGVDESQPYPVQAMCEYQRTKIIAEQEVLEANGRDGVATTALRPHIIYGPRDPHFIPRIAARARAGAIRQVGEGQNRVDVVYVENAARAHLQAADALAPDSPVAGHAYFISQGKPVILWDFLNRILEGLDLPPVTKKVPYGLAWTVGSVLERVHRLLGLRAEPRMTRFLAVQLGQSHWFDISRARRDFGYEPTIGTEEGLQRLLAHHSADRGTPP